MSFCKLYRAAPFASANKICLRSRPTYRNNARGQTLAILLGVALAMCGVTRPGSAQLAYDTTTFLHGFASGPAIWTTNYPDLLTTASNYLSGQVNLRGVKYPNLDSTARYNAQVVNLVSALTGGRHVLPGHSLGALVARGAYIDVPDARPKIAGIIAIAALHQGAPLADNFTLARSFFGDAQRRIENALASVRAEAPVVNFLTMAIPGAQGLGVALMAFIIVRTHGQVINFNNINSFGSVPALPDLSPSSAAVQHLSSHTDDAVIPRANLYGTIPHRNAALRVLKSSQNDDAGFEAAVRLKNQAVSTFKACRVIGYVTVVMWGHGRNCGWAVRVIGRIDERWAKYVNGSDQYGNPRWIPFDGVVPNERSQYPTPNALQYEFNVIGVNHLNIYKTRLGLDHVATAMRRIGMAEATGGPPPPPPPGGISVAVDGTNPIDVGCGGAWVATPAGGIEPYTYRWTVDGTPYDTGSSNELYYNPMNAGMLSIWVTATDSQGGTGTGQETVSVTSYGNCY